VAISTCAGTALALLSSSMMRAAQRVFAIAARTGKPLFLYEDCAVRINLVYNRPNPMVGVFRVFKGEKTMAVKKKAAKKPAKKKSARKPSAAFMKPMQITPALGAVIGAGPYPRTEVTKKLWAYIKKHGLQDSKNRRNINADEKLKEVFGGKKQVSMFDMTKLVSKHLK